MKCLICNKDFYIKKSFKNLFYEEKLYICNSCKERIPFKMEFNEIPLKNHILRVISSIDYKKYQNNYAFINEMSEIRNKIKEYRQDDFEYISDDFYLSNKKLEELELLSEITDKDILVITNTFRV